MRRRWRRVLGLVASGWVFQAAGCANMDIAELVAAGVRDTAVEVSSYYIDLLVNNIWELE